MAQWGTGRYGCETLPLTRGISGSVHYDAGGYLGEFMQIKVGPFTSIQEARLAVEGIARVELRKALARLDWSPDK